MKITLTDVTYNARLSKETECFRATVHIDEVAAFIVANDGRGGGNRYLPLDSSAASSSLMDERLRALERYSASLPAKRYDGVMHAWDAELLIAKALEDWLMGKEKRKFLDRMKRRVFAVVDGACLEFNVPKGETLAEAIEGVGRSNPKAKILNLLPEDEAWQTVLSLGEDG